MEVNGKEKDIKITEDNSLIIKTLHAAHAGEYECEATNEYGVLKQGFNIDVHCKLLYLFISLWNVELMIYFL